MNCIFFIFLEHVSNFTLIGYYLLFDLENYILCIILDYKNLKFKHLIDDIALDIWFSWNFASMEDMRKKKSVIEWCICQNSHPIKKILGGVVALVYNQVCFQILSKV